MELLAILASIRRNKVGAVLIAIQMAVTLAIVCNALFLIQQRVALTTRPTGVDEANILAIANEWIGAPTDLAARAQTDVASLRSLPGVLDAYVTNSVPLSNSGGSVPVNLQPDQQEPTAMAAAYDADDHGLGTLGLHLLAGRNFAAGEIVDVQADAPQPAAAVAIITRDLAERLFPGGKALGQSIFTGSQAPTRIVGIVDVLQVPWVHSGAAGNGADNYSILLPLRPAAPQSLYVMKVRPDALPVVRQAAPQTLRQIDHNRIMGSAYSLAEAREWAYHDDRGLVALLAAAATLLLTVTALGIVGLTSYWVTQRRRQIGVRRALGATRQAIVRYFQTENLLIAAVGSACGIALAIAVNLWMVNSFEMMRLKLSYAFAGAAAILLLGQLGTLYPALRAAAIPPALAARSA